MDRSARRVIKALFLLTGVNLFGALGIWIAGQGAHSLFESAYFSIYTISTVGFSELPGFEREPWARAFTGLLIVAGIGAIAYFQASVTALLVEGVIGRAFRRRRMQRRIAKMSGHYVIAGCGRTGKYVIEELGKGGRPFVVIERDEHVLVRLAEDLHQEVLYVVGDATEDHTLLAAGVDRAAGLVAALSDDRDNLFVTLSTRTLNPDARIVSKAVDTENEGKLARAGADLHSQSQPHRRSSLGQRACAASSH